MKKPRKTTRRKIVIHTLPVRRDSKMLAQSERMLQTADKLLEDSALLDTAVRDTIAEGLAYLVHSAYDTEAIAVGVSAEDFCRYIQDKTTQWFRKREFADWFCQGAGVLFNISTMRYRFEGRKVAKG